VRVAVIAESFLPEVNGVSGSVVRICEHLQRRGHQAVVLAAGQGAPAQVHGHPVIGLPSIGLPGYSQVRVCLVRSRRIVDILSSVRPDVVHLASPMVLGHIAQKAANELELPVVAAYQTDVAGFATHYAKAAVSLIQARMTEIHRTAWVNLVPSEFARGTLAGIGARNIRTWSRGVDHQLFHPGRRDEALRARWGHRVVVGYAGRLAAEKQVQQLAAIADLPGVGVVVIGDGPDRPHLQRALPTATFTGLLRGPELAAAVASLDVFVHSGEQETFCQGVQEALACGVPAVVCDAGAVPELVTPGHTGWIYRAGDTADLRDKVADLVSDDTRRAAMGVAAAASVADRTWMRVGDQLLGHYREAMGRRQERLAAG
jgi:phosphatidylinositol alpha 1,6-mannosyltransferase